MCILLTQRATRALSTSDNGQGCWLTCFNVQAFARQAGVTVETRDISLSGRILAAMSDLLPSDQAAQDAAVDLMAELARLNPPRD